MAKRKTKSADSAARPITPGEAGEAFARVREAIAAVPDSELIAINVDITRAVLTVLGALPGIAELMPELDKLPLKNAQLGKLRDYAFAAWFAHLTATTNFTEDAKEKFLAEAATLRADLMVAAEALAHKGLMDAKAVADIRAGSGNLDRANDLVALAALFTNAWERVRNKTTVDWTDVEKAAELGPQLLMALAARPGDAQEVEGTRARAFTLLARTYDQVRRGVTFLRWDDEDADQVAPSIYGGRKRRQTSAEKPEDGPAAPSPEQAPEVHASPA